MDTQAAAELLAAERERATARMAALRRGISSIDEATSGTATDDEHDPEGSTIAFERSQATTLLADAAEQIAEIDAALSRLEAGTYGTCESCGAPIAEARLSARPAARLCVSCAALPRKRR